MFNRRYYFRGNHLTHSGRHSSALSIESEPPCTHRKWQFILLSLIFIGICVVLTGRNANAQGTSGDVLGTVSDSSGAVIPNAAVFIKNTGTQESRKTVTGAQGQYTFALLQVGNYKVRVEVAGFKSLDLPQFTLTVGERKRVDAAMTIGEQTETLEVTGEPPNLQADSTTLGSTLEPQAVQDLPTEGRNLYSLVDLAPGANAGTPNGISSGNRSSDRRAAAEVQVNGQSDARNYNLLDGMDNNYSQWNIVAIRPSIDAIDEVSVATSNYPASLMSTAGAAVNVLTKSGTNKFHGTVYEYVRNDLFDSRDFFAKAGEVKKPEWRQNQFGGSVGGPVKRDKAFFFADVEDLRQIIGTTQTGTVPTLYEYNHIGDFTDITGGTDISHYPLDPAGVALYKLYPKPTNSAVNNNFTASPNRTQFSLTADGRADYHLSANDSMFARYSYNNVTTLTPGLFPSVIVPGVKEKIEPGGNIYGFQGTSYIIAHGGMVRYMHIFTPNLTLEAKTGFTRLYNNYVTLNGANNASTDLGIVNINVSPHTTGLTEIMPVDGYNSIGDSTYQPTLAVANNLEEMGTLSYIHSKHSISMGASLIRRQQNGFYAGAFPLGEYYFGYGSLLTSALPMNSMEDLLLGVGLEGQRQLNLTTQQPRSWETGFFFQDDWRVTQNLTLNLGVRYDVFTPVHDAKNDLANLEIDSQTLNSADFNLILASSSNPSVGVKTDYKNVTPRFGFADTIRNGTVLRGAFGLSYVHNNGQTGNNPPFAYNYGPAYFQGLDNKSIFGAQPLPLPPSSPAGVTVNPISSLTGTLTSIPSNLPSSYVEQFNLNLQQELGQNVITIAYVEELGRKLLAQPNTDLPDPSCGTASYTGSLGDLQKGTDGRYYASSCPQNVGGVVPAARYAAALPKVSTITQNEAAGSSSFTALEVTFVRHLSHGINLNANYTWAHELDNAPANTYPTSPWGLEPFNWQHYDYGNSDNDLRHRIAGSVVYTFPFTKTFRGVTGMLLKGWQTNAVGYWQTGQPFSVADGSQPLPVNLGGAIYSDRPQQLLKPTVSNPTINHAFNNTRYDHTLPATDPHNVSAAWGAQPVGFVGNERRNQLFGFHQRRLDLSLFRDFKVAEGTKVQFRAEAYNVTNTPDFGVPDSAMSDGAKFGVVNSTTPSQVTARVFQFAGKLVF